MRRTRTLLGVAAGTAALIGGMLASADLARADVTYCRATSPYKLLGAGMYGATWVTNGRLVRELGQKGLVTNCLYEGDRYQFASGGYTTYLGRARFWDPSRLVVDRTQPGPTPT
jgi:hypothetical protein